MKIAGAACPELVAGFSCLVRRVKTGGGGKQVTSVEVALPLGASQEVRQRAIVAVAYELRVWTSVVTVKEAASGEA